MFSNDKWYAINKSNQHDKINLIAENKKLREENDYLRQKIAEIVNKSMDF